MSRKRKQKEEKDRQKHKYIFVYDIHSNIKTLKKLPELIPEWKDDNTTIVFGGDYIDGFIQNKNDGLEVLKFVMNCVESGKGIALLGNHDKWLVDILSYDKDSYQVKKSIDEWSINGLDATLSSWGFDPADVRYLDELLMQSKYKDVCEWLKSGNLKKYAVLGYRNDIFAVHAGFDLTKSLSEQDEDDMLWIRDKYFHEPLYLQYPIAYEWKHSTIVTGHTPNQLISSEFSNIPNSPEVLSNYITWFDLHRYFIDAGSNSTSNPKDLKLNILILDDEQGFIRSELI